MGDKKAGKTETFEERLERIATEAVRRMVEGMRETMCRYLREEEKQRGFAAYAQPDGSVRTVLYGPEHPCILGEVETTGALTADVLLETMRRFKEEMEPVVRGTEVMAEGMVARVDGVWYTHPDSVEELLEVLRGDQGDGGADGE